MEHLLIDLTGKDSVFISNVYRYHSGLCGLSLYRNHPKQLPSLDQLKEKIDLLQQAYEGGTTGNRVQIALRTKLRKELAEIFKKITAYLQSVATEDDIPALLQAGFSVKRVGTRKKPVVAPAT